MRGGQYAIHAVSRLAKAKKLRHDEMSNGYLELTRISAWHPLLRPNPDTAEKTGRVDQSDTLTSQRGAVRARDIVNQTSQSVEDWRQGSSPAAELRLDGWSTHIVNQRL